MLDINIFADADCGKGFSRIADRCVLVTSKTMKESEVAAACTAVSATPYKTTSATLFHQVGRLNYNLFKIVTSSKSHTRHYIVGVFESHFLQLRAILEYSMAPPMERATAGSTRMKNRDWALMAL